MNKLYFQTNRSGILHKTFDVKPPNLTLTRLSEILGKKVDVMPNNLTLTRLNCTAQVVAVNGVIDSGPDGEFVTNVPPDHKYILCRRCFGKP